MAFLRPLFLWGLLAVLVPVAVHLLGRRRVRLVPVATLRFLEAARARASSRWRLRRLLLLAARAAALGLLALLFAGPGCDEPGASSGPTTWVLVLDTSPSMAAARGGRSSLERARAELVRLLDRADPRDRFLAVTTAEGGREDDGWHRGFTSDRSGLRRRLASAPLEYGPHRPDRALERAFRLLDGVEGGRVVLATDLQASAWGDDRVSGAGRVPLRLVDAGWPAPQNTWVAGLDEGTERLRATLGRSGGKGDTPAEDRKTVRLKLEDGQAFTAFAQGADASFRPRLPAGLYTGEVWVEPGGDLALDDRAWFVGRGASKIRLLLVNGDPRGFEIRDELFFVRRALAPGGKLGDGFEVREVRGPDLSTTDFEGCDVALLANPGTLGGGPAVVEALRERVNKGLGLVVAAGDRWRPGEVGALGALLAAPLRDVVSSPPPQGEGRNGEGVDASSFEGPLTPFRLRDAGDLAQTRVWTYWVPETRPGRSGAEGVTALARLTNGAPLVLDRRSGKGHTLLLTTTVDRDGSDLCLQPAFVPWLDRLLRYAGGRLRPSVGRWVAAGHPLTLPYGGPVSLEGPAGFKASWVPGAPPFVPPAPGVYRVRDGDTWIDGFGAGLDPRESDLTRLDVPALDRRLGREGYDLGNATRPARAGTVGRRDVSARCAAALLFALAAEGLLSGRWGGRRRPQPALPGREP